jgi:preprotein translocase subunit SecE
LIGKDMARDNSESFFSNLYSGGLFKPTQGLTVRRITGLVLSIGIIVGCYVMTETVLVGTSNAVRYGVPFALGALGLWAVFRTINFPRFANFLIQVEGEMTKVSWAEQAYLVRATGVVIGTMILLGAFLLVCDLIWVEFFELIGFLHVPETPPK